MTAVPAAPQVLIMGAGVAGCTLGRALARAGIPARIFDAAPSPAARLNRGLGLWPNSQKCLEDVGVCVYMCCIL
jgi:2-polyprenyl-6-methoxyphenol hydroxylase-like FAD-dependent oxidoreductase